MKTEDTEALHNKLAVVLAQCPLLLNTDYVRFLRPKVRSVVTVDGVL